MLEIKTPRFSDSIDSTFCVRVETDEPAIEVTIDGERVYRGVPRPVYINPNAYVSLREGEPLRHRKTTRPFVFRRVVVRGRSGAERSVRVKLPA